MKERRQPVVFIVLFVIGVLAGGATAGEMQATVAGLILTSTAFPEGTISFDKDLTYVGSERFILYKVANCEIHLFVEADEKRVKRLYWIQFEGYLPRNDHRYDYSGSEKRTEIDGHPFHDDVWFMDMEKAKERWRPGSDSKHVMQLLEKHGYHVEREIMGVRLVRLDKARRNELMIIYYEDLADHDLAVADLTEGGRAAGDWPKISAGLRRRALAGMKLSMR